MKAKPILVFFLLAILFLATVAWAGSNDLAPAAYLPLILNGAPQTGVATISPTIPPVITQAATETDCVPTITITHLPPFGSFDDLAGQTTCVDPDDYAVAVYIFVSVGTTSLPGECA
jgi:hypothetical protein